MGQTLTHGVYLPDEGERNCYNGLAANWQLLDNSVGTIAEHTSALSGKAPLAHTHGNITNDGKVGTTANKPLITGTGGVVQAGSFGTAANTFCEGNDSRLSDARTPLSHTHTKSDITDFPVYGTTAGTICEGNDSRLSDARTPVAHTHTKNDVTDLLNSDFIPSANNSYNLGSSSYQWNNLYAKNYYYNGVAWGLDKANQWTKTQTFNADTIYRSTVKRGTAPGSVVYMEFADYKDSSNNRFSLIGASYTTAKASDCCIYAYKTTVATGNAIGKLGIGCDTSGNVYTIAPTPASSDNSTQIATTAYVKSQGYLTLNGMNPGVLSLPDYDASIAQDISGDMIPDQYNNIKFTSNLDGWMYIDFNVSSATLLSGADYLVQSKDNNLANATHAINFVRVVGNHIFVYQPVLKNEYIILELNFSGFSIGKAYIYPCLGNV